MSIISSIFATNIRFLFCVLSFSILPLSQPNPTIILLQAFVRDAANQQLDNGTLEQRYFCQGLLQKTPDGDKLRTIADYYISSLRRDLNEEHVKPEDVLFLPFDSLSKKDIEIIGKTNQVYVAQYKGKILDYFLIQDGKISSFLLMNTGKRSFFVTFCN